MSNTPADNAELDKETPRKPNNDDCDKGIHRPCYCAGRKECHDCGLPL